MAWKEVALVPTCLADPCRLLAKREGRNSLPLGGFNLWECVKSLLVVSTTGFLGGGGEKGRKDILIQRLNWYLV